MRRTITFLTIALAIAATVPAFAELQNVEVGGSIRIRLNYFSEESGLTAALFDDSGISGTFIEQRTRLNVRADFTNDVSAFIELDSYDIFGEDFRGVVTPLVTGADVRSSTGLSGTPIGGADGDVEVYQSYIETRNTWGVPLTIRLGRQEIVFGSEWLMGNNDTSSLFRGLSYDAVTIRYDLGDVFNVTGVFAQLAELDASAEDDDVTLYVVYASYTGLEDIVIDGYWMYVRDGRLGVSNLHTLGLRGAGNISQFDWEVEVAYQFGDAFDDTFDIDAFGANLDVGYTFDISWQPRIGFGFAYFEGGQGDDLSFNRLFSDWEYSEFLANTDLSNAFVFIGSLGTQPTENIELLLRVAFFQADEDVARGDEDLGWELGLYMTYHYTEDLAFEFGYAHFFADDGAEDGVLSALNGFGLIGGSGEDDDADYLYFETQISF